MSSYYETPLTKAEMNVILETAFSRKFTFRRDDTWTFPEPEEWTCEGPWVHDTLQDLKVKLNSVKGLLNHTEPSSWRRHTTNTSIAGRVVPHLQNVIKPELLTQAWCKFWEVLQSYIVVPNFKSGKVFRSVHLCEAPGAFVTSLNHYMKSERPSVVWEWIASTLNPYYEGNSTGSAILDDRFIFHTLDNWHFGTANTGDILSSDVVNDLILVSESNTIHFVSADGSIDCQDVPAEQEKTIAKLLYAETYTALSMLSKNCSFVVKMFTFFEAETVSLLLFLTLVFREVHAFKPVTSKPGNSEAYVICLGYMGKKKIGAPLQKLRDYISKSEPMFKKEQIPEGFWNQVIECAKTFAHSQMETIQRNIAQFENLSISDEKFLKVLKEMCVQLFMERYHVRTIDNSQKLAPNMSKLGETMLFQYSQKPGIFSFSERQRIKNSSFRKQGIINSVARESLRSIENNFLFRDTSSINALISELVPGHVVIGRKIEKICSSLFCPIQLLTSWKDLVDMKRGIYVGVAQDANKSWIETVSPLIHEVFEEESCQYKIYLSPEIVMLTHRDNQTQVKSLPVELKNESSWDITTESFSETEIHFQRTLINNCLKFMYLCKVGDSLVLRLESAHTRFTVGILFLLASIFTNVQVVDPSKTYPLHPSLWCFQKFKPNENMKLVFDHFGRISKYFQKLESQEKLVLESVSLPILCGHPFYQFVINTNSAILLRKILHLSSK